MLVKTKDTKYCYNLSDFAVPIDKQTWKTIQNSLWEGKEVIITYTVSITERKHI